ncbi:YCF48-related protein [Winogradskyella aurantiaca]|uniref:YCF48-related protein n=1 Tax=Winogradskyella aurantiaca TaxID=2219558 RepID=UPI000E1DCF79|nr:YCF48-related protein [Winogradskyella aurantiaca]
MKLILLCVLSISLGLVAQPTWQNLPDAVSNPNNQRFDDVYFINGHTGWAANGAFASVYKTSDGGMTWTEQLSESDLSGNFYFRAIEFLNADVGFLGTLSDAFFWTQDGGDNWELVDNITPYPEAICGLDAVNSNTIYGCGAYFTPAYIIKSTDSGDSWTYIDMSSYATALVDIHFANESIGYAAGRNVNGALILKTTNGGTDWVEIFNSNIPGEYVWKLQVLDSNTDVIFGSVFSIQPFPGKLIKSTNAGEDWNSYDAPETDVQAVGFITENTGWMGGYTTGFYETQDGGQTWTDLGVGSNLNKIFVINSTLAYGAGTTLYKFSDASLSTEEDANLDPNDTFIQLENNPVANMLKIDIRYLSNDHLRIQLYDVNGKYLKDLLIDKISEPSTRFYEIDVSELSSGSYFLDLHTNLGRKSLKFIKI